MNVGSLVRYVWETTIIQAINGEKSVIMTISTDICVIRTANLLRKLRNLAVNIPTGQNFTHGNLVAI